MARMMAEHVSPQPATPTLTLQHRRRLPTPLSLPAICAESCSTLEDGGLGSELQEAAVARGSRCRPTGQSSCSDAWAQYQLCEVLGRGAVGVVHRAKRNEDGSLVALKVVHIIDDAMASVARHEFEVLQQLDSPHIVRALDFFADALQSVVVLEWFESANLTSTVLRAPKRRLPEDISWKLARSLLEALDYMHTKGFVHRDVKPDNILVSQQTELRLIDFHTARFVRSDDSREGGGGPDLSLAGTPLYTAPEVLNLGEPALENTDIWAAGLCLYFMLSRRLPRGCGEAQDSATPEEKKAGSFDDAASSGAAAPFEASLFRESCWGAVSEQCKATVRKCLAAEQWWTRPSASALLADEWLQGEMPLSSSSRFISEELPPLSPMSASWSTATTATTVGDDGVKPPAPISLLQEARKALRQWDRQAPRQVGAQPAEDRTALA